MQEENKQQEQQTYLDDILADRQNLQEQLNAAQEQIKRMAEDNKTITRNLLEGNIVNEEPKDKRTISEIIKDTRNSKNDVEYIKNALAFRKKCIEEGYADPFTGHGPKYEADDREQEKADRFADIMQEIVDYADGNNDVFINEVNRRTIEGPIHFNRR